MIFSTEAVEAAVSGKTKIRVLPGGEGAMLVGSGKPFEGYTFTLNKSTVAVGRRADQDVVLDDAGISAIHAQLVCEDGGWKVVNLLSSNGTFVNGKKIAISSVNNGDRVRFGKSEFIFKSGTVGDDVTQKTASGTVNRWLLTALVISLAALVAVLLMR